ncbi:class C sortase [Streptococcus castoreus]|uniref:class C sortase n=1 Tax=Streptococcus castoreus TaxID=254786 RepID=UPI00040957B4|nr:class C sortase [Streptococcus castoreus]
MPRNKQPLSVKERFIQIMMPLLFLMGCLTMLYPFASNYYYRVKQNQVVTSFESAKAAVNKDDIKRRMALARAYNATLDPGRINDPYTDLEKKGVAEYARMLELNEQIGYVEVPRFDINLPIYAGTSEDVLQKAAGHLEGTSLPIGGDSTHTVITAHTGLPQAKLFTDIHKMKKGDLFFIHNIDKTLAYKVDQILVVEPDDFPPVLVTKGFDYATLLTCTPYGINSHRLLVRGYRVPYQKAFKKADAQRPWYAKPIFLVSLLLFVILVMILLINWYRKRYRKD